LVKEIRLALDHNFVVEIICFEFENWSKRFNEELKKEFLTRGAKLHIIQAGRKPFAKWFGSVIFEKKNRLLHPFSNLRPSQMAQAVSRRNRLLLQSFNKIKSTDWVIGHNPGALYATCVAAQHFNCKAGFDVEDYHPGEGNNVRLQHTTKQLMKEILSRMDYVSFAAPLIKKTVEKDLGKEGGGNWITILNYFPATEFVMPSQTEGPLKLVWFSQNIGPGRGLEMVLPIINKYKGDVELHLYGNMDTHFFEQELKQVENVITHEPLSQKELHRQLSKYDVGFAIEPAKDKNNELAISNKLLAYMQAGLYVMATATSAQKNFLSNFQENGICFEYFEKEFKLVLDSVITNIKKVRASKLGRYLQFKENNWETESKNLLSILSNK
jgi:glycosyltransferase involved in cell wall biosynthesis